MPKKPTPYTPDEVIAALKQLEAHWPKDLYLFAWSGTLVLLKGTPGDARETMVENEVESFLGIHCDGGDP